MLILLSQYDKHEVVTRDLLFVKRVQNARLTMYKTPEESSSLLVMRHLKIRLGSL